MTPEVIRLPCETVTVMRCSVMCCDAISRVSFSFQLFAGEGGGGKMILYGFLGSKYVSVCKACGNKLWGSGGMLPWKFLTFTRRNLVESGTAFTQTDFTMYYYFVSLKPL